MSFIKIDICKAGAFRPNVCGRRGKRSCKQQQRWQEKKCSVAQLLVAAPPRAHPCFCKASIVVAVVAFFFFFLRFY